MKKTVIRILKDTPFNLAGEELNITDFRNRYNYICSKYTKDEELIEYIKQWNSSPYLRQTTKFCISDWFKVIESVIPPVVPLEFIYDGLLYSKQFDGYYHKFIVGNDITPDNSLGIETNVDILLNNARFKKNILYATSNVNKKL